MPLRRLESEVIRDSMLSIAGTLNPKMGGEPVKTIAEADGMVTVNEKALADPADRYRRSIYLVARRRYNLSMLGRVRSSGDEHERHHARRFRGGAAIAHDDERQRGAGAVGKFAARLMAQAGRVPPTIRCCNSPSGIRTAAAPEADELQWTRGLLGRERGRYRTAGKTDTRAEALASVCHVLFNTNEFLYVE